MGIYHIRSANAKLKIELKINSEIKTELMPITNCILYIILGTLAKIREFYIRFKKISNNVNYKYVSYNTFGALFDWLHIPYAEVIFDEFDYKRKDKINIYQFLSILIWTSFASIKSKIKCIFCNHHSYIFVIRSNQ